MRVSYSQIGTFEQCPYKWYLRYIEQLETLEPNEPDNALILGNALHKGMELRDVQAGVDYYREQLNIYDDRAVNEEIKLRAMIAKGLEIVPEGFTEQALEAPEEFKGFIDLLVPTEQDKPISLMYDMYDYKYANAKSADKYRNSSQLSVYKWYLERLNPAIKVRNMYFVLFPKVSIRQKKTETLDGFRRRLRETLADIQPEFIRVEYDEEQVHDFLREKEELEQATDFPKCASRLCDWCEYQSYCERNELTMMLPKAERQARTEQGKIKLWIYGDPFSGKTTFANGAPMPLMLNTDGNIKFVDAPAIPIKDELKTEGRMTKKVFGWAKFKESIDELDKDPQGYETVVVDLTEGVYELCRTYMYDKRGWEHESDDSFKAWDIVRKEFLDTMRRVTNLDMNVILISHEDSSRDFTRPTGNKVTALKPNIADKVAKQLAGMVDVVGRVVVRDGSHMLTFKTDETVFGGGRLKMPTNEMPLDWATFEGVYMNEVSGNGTPVEVAEKPKRKSRAKKAEPEAVEAEIIEPTDDEPPFEVEPEVVEEKPKRRRRARASEDVEPEATDDVEPEEKPKRRTRKKRSE